MVSLLKLILLICQGNLNAEQVLGWLSVICQKLFVKSGSMEPK